VSLPERYVHLVNLTSLNFDSNNMTAIPSTIAQLTRLQLLSLQYNKLASIPAELSKLRDLRILKVSFNCLTELPVSLCNMQVLRELHVRGNPSLKKLSWRIGMMKSLEIFDIGEWSDDFVIDYVRSFFYFASNVIYFFFFQQESPILDDTTTVATTASTTDVQVPPFQFVSAAVAEERILRLMIDIATERLEALNSAGTAVAAPAAPSAAAAPLTAAAGAAGAASNEDDAISDQTPLLLHTSDEAATQQFAARLHYYADVMSRLRHIVTASNNLYTQQQQHPPTSTDINSKFFLFIKKNFSLKYLYQTCSLSWA